MPNHGVIAPSQSEWATSFLFALKKYGTYRLCVDYLRLNSMTFINSDPIPRMDEFSDSLGDASILSSTHFNGGYWHLPLHPDESDKTTFTSHYGTFRYTRMSSGLNDAPVNSQREVDVVLLSVKWQFALMYIDDITIFIRSIEDPFRHLGRVLNVMRNDGFSLKLKKSFFLRQEGEYLIHLVLTSSASKRGRATPPRPSSLQHC